LAQQLLSQLCSRDYVLVGSEDVERVVPLFDVGEPVEVGAIGLLTRFSPLSPTPGKYR
jgi:hypothetical protein